MGDRHACPDCGASHARRAPRVVKRTSVASSTDLSAARCPHCKAPVLAGRVDALETMLDPHPVNELGHATYKALGRTMYTRTESRARTHSYATRWPPDKGYQTFHVQHVCGKPIPALLVENNVVRKQRIVQLPAEPNF